MKVRAIKSGYHGGTLRRAGDVFDVPDGAKASWFVGVDAVDAAKQKTKAAKPKAEPSTFSEVTKADAEAMKVKGADDDLV